MTPQGIDLHFDFDTTGSMYPCLSQVRCEVDQLCAELFDEIPDLRIGISVHGDYCDARTTYVTKALPFTRDRIAVSRFVNQVVATNGGDLDECYELVLHEARSLPWKAERARIFTMIGDANPHGVNYPQNRQRLDWRNEARLLGEMGVQIYAVQALNYRAADGFYNEVARLTGGIRIGLNQLRMIGVMIRGIAFKQTAGNRFDQYEQQMFTRNSGNEVRNIFNALRRKPAAVPRRRSDGLIPVDPARFQVFDVPGTPRICDFVRTMGIEFKTGRGFYPHEDRTELIQERKEVILEDLVTGELFTGPEVRERIGLPYGTRGRVKKNPVPGFRTWVQSTSYTRDLRNNLFMYEVPEKMD